MAGDGEYFRKRLLGVLCATWIAQACSVLAALGLPDRMAAGARSTAELAAAQNLDPVAPHRLLAALADNGILKQTAADQFELTQVGQYLRSDVPGSAHGTALLYGGVAFPSFDGLLGTVRTGRPAFTERFGQPFYEYLGDNPDVAASFNAAISAMPEPAPPAPDLFDSARTVVDIGGGDGSLLAQILGSHPEQRGVLVELPDAAARAHDRLAGAGLLGRVRIEPGSFFDHLPEDGDLYVLRRVLHNWNDENAARLLRGVHAAMPAGARLLILEALLPEAPDPNSATACAWAAPRNRLIDLLMLVLMEGRDRTTTEYTALLEDSGFAVKSVTPGAIEAVAA